MMWNTEHNNLWENRTAEYKHYIVSGKTIEIMGALLLYRTAHAHACI